MKVVAAITTGGRRFAFQVIRAPISVILAAWLGFLLRILTRPFLKAALRIISVFTVDNNHCRDLECLPMPTKDLKTLRLQVRRVGGTLAAVAAQLVDELVLPFRRGERYRTPG